MQSSNTKLKDEAFTSPRNNADSTTVKKGSIALMVWVKETATFPRLMLVKRFPIVCTMARGTIAISFIKHKT